MSISESIRAFKLAYKYVPHVDAGGGLQLSATAGISGFVFLAAAASFALGAFVAGFGGLLVGLLAASHAESIIRAELKRERSNRWGDAGYV